MTFVIYKITNLINNKVYIGQTNNFERRCGEYQYKVLKNNPCQVIIQAMIKYGIDNFSFEIIFNALSREELNLIEPLFIKQYNSLIPNGYNVEVGGLCAPISQESLNKISKALKGRPSLNKGKPCSEEQKLKTSKTMSGRKYSQERVFKTINSLKGRIAWNKGKYKLSDEQIIAVKQDHRTYKEISKEYCISTATISKIKNSE